MDTFERKEQVARIRKQAAKETKTPSAKLWLERDEFGGIDKSIHKLLDELEPIRVAKGLSVESMEREIILVIQLSVLEALLNHANKSDAKKNPRKKRI